MNETATELGRPVQTSLTEFRWNHELNAVMAIWIREFKTFQREKSRVIASLATPILWIALVGTGFASAIPPEALGGLDYRRFLFPGIIAQAVLFGTVFYGMYIIWDKKLDVLKEILVAPVSRTSVFVGKVLGGSTESVIQGAILLAIGIAFFDVTVLGALEGLVIVLLLAISFVSIGLFIGSFFESMEGFNIVISFLLFPLFFLSGALFPLGKLASEHAWLYWLIRANPATYAVDGLRAVTLGAAHHEFPLALDVGVLVAFGAFMAVAGSWAFKRMKL
ncbi:MAG TPA: ABC transporter permease [Candidatus Thermoplasmatota archaeon]|nr:ABC transporter permease [Candidatus Thermoplasmatota archaeon]